MPHNERASERIGTYIFIGQHDIIVALTFVKKDTIGTFHSMSLIMSILWAYFTFFK